MSSSEGISPPGTTAQAHKAAGRSPLDFRARWRKLKLIGEIVYHEMVEDRLFTQAAALTYKTLFSLLPVFVLSLLILSKISGVDGVPLDKQFKNEIYSQLKIDTMTITEDATPAPAVPVSTEEQPTSAPEAASSQDGSEPAELVATTPATMPSSQSQPATRTVKMTDITDRIINNGLAAVTNPATGLIAFGILLYGAISLMLVIETTFNQMFGSGNTRSWGRRIMLYWCVLTLGPIGVGASLALGGVAAKVADGYSGNALGWIFSIASFLSGYVISWILFVLLYKLIPQTRVNWRHAAMGAAVAGIAWEIGKTAFGLYIKHALKGSWYGSMAVLPLFMFWIYISWSIVLMGLELTYVQQYWRRMKRRYLFLRARKEGMGGFGDSVLMSDIRWVLSLAIMMYRRFKEGKTTGVEEAAEALMLPNDVTGAMLTAMEREGLVVCTAEAGSRYTLARPAENITAFDLLNSMRSVSEIPAELIKEREKDAAASGAMREFQELETNWAKKRTLAELAS